MANTMSLVMSNISTVRIAIAKLLFAPDIPTLPSIIAALANKANNTA